MRNKIFSLVTVALATVSLFLVGCEDGVSNIGGSITSTDVSIRVDSITYKLDAATVAAPSFESRSSYNLLGSIRVPEYGMLDCSYVTQFLPAESLNIPDSISADNIDSVKLVLSIPKNYVTGDTLAPLQFTAYSLTKQLPSDISSSFSPEGYYNPTSPLAKKSYTLSGYTFNDSTYLSKTNLEIKSDLPVEIGKELVKTYKENPDIFVWPQKFAELWPGIFVETSFGKGCVAPVASTSIYAYFPQTKVSTGIDEDGKPSINYTQIADSVCLLTTAPEVLANVNISYQPSESLSEIASTSCIITTPGGFTTSFVFPVQDILKDYWDEEYNLGVINNMIFSIPAKTISNSYGLGITPALLMVKTSEMESFFSEGRIPDNVTSFTSIYSTETNSYTFSSMRQYIVDMKNKGKDNITADDVEFTLIPVNVTTEDYTDMSTGALVTVVTSITPYILMPTMTELDTDNALIVFTYSNQILN